MFNLSNINKSHLNMEGRGLPKITAKSEEFQLKTLQYGLFNLKHLSQHNVFSLQFTCLE